MTARRLGRRPGERPVRTNSRGRQTDWNTGEPVLRAEKLRAMKALLADPAHYSDQEIARRLGICDRSVLRYRTRQDPPIPNFYERRRQ